MDKKNTFLFQSAREEVHSIVEPLTKIAPALEITRKDIDILRECRDRLETITVCNVLLSGFRMRPTSGINNRLSGRF